MSATNPIRDTSLTYHMRTQDAVSQELHQTSPSKRIRTAADPKIKDRFGLIVSLFFCAGIAIFLVGQYANLIVTNYQVQGMQVTLSHEVARDAALQSTVYELSSPTRILHIAEHVLDMQPATPVEVGTSAP
ncbi:MAG: hypothetical protein OWR52_05410 [Acidibacillus sp.]|uniref:Cell division protein FtsL n=1 Tax=Sulfoacidibacillus ferrooxidans TaxID=2005001 RepID=A0A9X2AAN1_9BACL|nr:hypothetical protein [Sulfoacidibacillus ferrooxidans]MCI0181779.1 Cell division protein FtsL [Sulfoacidibacillus ferrooxidans]MCY0892922.1 hypothetical protein [Acidibacillus sp.]